MSVPSDPRSSINLEQQRKRAKDLRRAHRDGSIEAAVRIVGHLPRARLQAPEAVLASAFTLSEAQLVVAREAGFSSWPTMRHQLESARDVDVVEEMIDAALAGDDDGVRAALEKDPNAARRSILAAAAAAEAEAVFALLDDDRSLADRRGGRREWTPLLYLCCSRYRRGQRDATAARVAVARRLVALGADVNAIGKEPGFTADGVTQMFDDHKWRPLEGAAGRVASPEVVRLLVFAGAALAKTTAVLSQAVRGGNIDVLRLLLESAPEDWYQVIWALKACVVLERPDMARLLIAHGARSRNRGATVAQQALLEAIRLERDVEMIDVLLGNDDNSDLTRPVRQDLYRHAVRHGHSAAGELLRRRGADEATMTPVDRAIGASVIGDGAELHRLLTETPDLKSALGEEDHRMLAWAIRRGHYQAVPLLLEVGLDPNVPDNDGEMPLHLAVRAGSLDALDMVLGAGASVDGRNFDAQTPLEVALGLPPSRDTSARLAEAEGGGRPDAAARQQLTRRLLDAGAVPSRMSQFTPDTDRRNAEIDEELRRGGAVEREDPDLLFERAADAVAFGDLETLRELLDEEPALVHARSPRPHRCTLLNYCGANGTEDPRQRTPSNAPAVAQLLLERGADPNATCKLYGGGSTTMGLLLTSMHPNAAGLDGELVRVLARFGAKLGTADLVYAIDSGAPRAVSAMVEAGVPINTLFVAAGLDRVDVMEELLSRGADINARGSDWYSTALHAAAGMGQKRAVRFLLDRGADTSLHNTWDAAPADTARHFGHDDVADLIEKRDFTSASSAPPPK